MIFELDDAKIPVLVDAIDLLLDCWDALTCDDVEGIWRGAEGEGRKQDLLVVRDTLTEQYQER